MKKTLFIYLSLFLLLGISNLSKAQTSADSVYTSCEVMPQYPGGDAALIQFIMNNIQYPELAKTKGIQGIVYVNFIIEKDGSISSIKVLRGIGGGCDEEAMRVVKLLSKWKAGKDKGTLVRCQYNLPIRFTL